MPFILFLTILLFFSCSKSPENTDKDADQDSLPTDTLPDSIPDSIPDTIPDTIPLPPPVDMDTVLHRVHLFNPWLDSGFYPFLQGATIIKNGLSWQRVAMTLEDQCGWYRYEFMGPVLGDFRFNRNGSWTDCYGPRGHQCDQSSVFNLESYLQDTTDVWIASPSQAPPSIFKWKPLMPGCLDGYNPPKPAAGEANYPFPQEGKNPFGIAPSSIFWTDVQDLFSIWRKNFVVSEGDLTRVMFDEPSLTVSEGIGYGMLISVFMDNEQNKTRAEFDGMWRYYQKFADPYTGLMAWKINGFTGIINSGAATDGDLDVALALIMASKQWKDPTYLNAAITMIQHIKEFEVDVNGILKPGDMWDEAKNPSYFSFVALKAFSTVDITNSAYWNGIIAPHYKLILDGRNDTTGLIANWTDATGLPKDPGNGYGAIYADFGFDAIRVPWRTAWAYLWYGDASAKDIASTISAWSFRKTGGDPGLIRDLYTLTGTSPNAYSAGPTYVGAFAAATATTSDVNYLDQLWAQLKSQTGKTYTTYYHSSLQVLYALLITGMMPNLLEK